MCPSFAPIRPRTPTAEQVFGAKVLARARMLCERAQGASALPLPSLRGRRIAVLCDVKGDPGAASFLQAMQPLAVEVSEVRPGFAEDAAEQVVRSAARLFGCLYDVLDCEAMPPGVVERLRAHAGVPVLGSLGSASLELAGCEGWTTDRKGLGSPAPEAWRRALLQASVIESLEGSGL